MSIASSSSSSVNSCTKYEPASGSTVSAVPVSSARICCVRSARVAVRSVGMPSASSIAFVCRDCVPPSMADNAWNATRTRLFSGCWAVSETPAVCVWKRRRRASGSSILNSSRSNRDHIRRAARNLAISSKKSELALKKNDICRAMVSGSSSRCWAWSRYSTALESVKAISWGAVAPFSRMWYPLTEMLFQRGKCFWQYSITSTTRRMDASGG